MKSAGALMLMLAITLSLSSFRAQESEAFVMPVVEHEARPSPVPYTLPLQYAALVIYYSDETGVPVWMASRLFAQESTGDPMSGKWNPRAVSWMGAQGLAQLMPQNLELFSRLYNSGRPVDPFDPETAIRVGLRYLADLHSATGSWRIAVMAYNGGLGHWLDPRRYGEWQYESIAYVRAIMGKEPVR